MLLPRLVRHLTLDPAPHPRGLPHLSAASGLVRVHDRFYVVADDELHLGVFSANDRFDQPVELIRVFEGVLPGAPKKRKSAKPDLEALALLPPSPIHPHGALLALGSGSRPTREGGVLLGLDAQGGIAGEPARLDLSPLYAPLHARFADLNIEGAFVADSAFLLLQRGNRSNGRNACIRYDLNQILRWLMDQQEQTPAIASLQEVQLGEINGVPLGLTDGAALPGGAWVFSAVAENTHDSYHDGACMGSVIGIVGPDGSVLAQQALHGSPKVEGVAVQVDGASLRLRMVTDADDPAIAAQLLQVDWENALQVASRRQLAFTTQVAKD